MTVVVSHAASSIDPKLGDMIVFDPAGRPFYAMHHSGGSFIVERRGDGNHSLYWVHWAGGFGGAGSDTCGIAAELALTGPDLELLASAAGGWGIRHVGVASISVLAKEQAVSCDTR